MTTYTFKDFAEFKTMKGEELSPTPYIEVTQEMINAFAQGTQDDQWIHTDPEMAAKHSPFKKTIAHGFMSLSLIPKMLNDLIKVQSMKMGVNYGLNNVRLPHPVVVGSRVRLLTKVIDVEDFRGNGYKVTWHCTVEIENESKPACVAEFISLVFE